MGNVFGFKAPDPVTAEFDADSIIYGIGFVVDREEGGKKLCDTIIEAQIGGIWEDTGCNKMNAYLGTDTNFRLGAAKLLGYKENRSKKERPKYYDYIRARLVTEYDAILVHDMEAEDAVGIAAYSYSSFKDFIIVAVDKDLDMLAGTRYNFRTRKTKFITKLDAVRSFYGQLLAGDMTDNIPGLFDQLKLDGEMELANKLKGSRYKSKFTKELAEMTDELNMWNAVVSKYEEYGQVERHGLDRILEISQLLWLRRTPTEVWVPPTERDFDYITYDDREEL